MEYMGFSIWMTVGRIYSLLRPLIDPRSGVFWLTLAVGAVALFALSWLWFAKLSACGDARLWRMARIGCAITLLIVSVPIVALLLAEKGDFGFILPFLSVLALYALPSLAILVPPALMHLRTSSEIGPSSPWLVKATSWFVAAYCACLLILPVSAYSYVLFETIASQRRARTESQARRAEQRKFDRYWASLGASAQRNGIAGAVTGVDYERVYPGSLLPLRKLNDIEWLGFAGSNVNDDDLKFIENLTKLKGLNLSDTRITDNGLQHLRNLTSLETLRLNDTAITDEGIKYLDGLTRLQHLELQRTAITDSSVDRLSKLYELELLRVSGTKMSAEGAERLRAGSSRRLVVQGNFQPAVSAGRTGED
ncbi:MAG: leucine-rich repeat domain-containing protein [Pirellulales bacterium]